MRVMMAHYTTGESGRIALFFVQALSRHPPLFNTLATSRSFKCTLTHCPLLLQQVTATVCVCSMCLVVWWLCSYAHYIPLVRNEAPSCWGCRCWATHTHRAASCVLGGLQPTSYLVRQKKIIIACGLWPRSSIHRLCSR